MGEVNTGGGVSVGGDANAGHDFVGRDRIDVHVETPPIPPNHPLRQYTLADVLAALIGDPLTGAPGLVADVADLRQELAELKRNQYPRWFQVLIIVLAVALIVLLVVVLIRTL